MDGLPHTFVHVAPDGERVPYSTADNALIARAQHTGAPCVRINDVQLPTTGTLCFEVRFGAHAKSRHMPGGSPTGICQVNIDNENTRVVEERGGAAAVGAAAHYQPPPRPLAADRLAAAASPRGGRRPAGRRVPQFERGDRVEYLSRTLGGWEPCMVGRVHTDGSLRLESEHGELVKEYAAPDLCRKQVAYSG